MNEMMENWVTELFDTELDNVRATIANERIWANGATEESEVEMHEMNIRVNEEYFKFLQTLKATALSQVANYECDTEKKTKKVQFSIIHTYETEVNADMETSEAIDYVCARAYELVEEGKVREIKETIDDVCEI